MRLRYSATVLAAIVLLCAPTFAAPTVDEAWRALPKYEPGQDMAPLLVIDGEVIKAMGSPEAKAACAARLGKLLESDETTVAAKKYICLQLRQVGTAVQVDALAGLLDNAELGQVARGALEQIPGEESAAALRAAIGKLTGAPLAGVIESIGVRRDVKAVDALIPLVESKDREVSAAALAALSAVGDEKACGFVGGWFLACHETPTPRPVAAAAVEAAEFLLAAGKKGEVEKIAEKLTQAGENAPFRRAGFDLVLLAAGENRFALIEQWLGSDDTDRRRTAQIALVGLSDADVKKLVDKLGDLPSDSQMAVIQASVARGDKEIAAVLKKAVEGDDPAMSRAAIEWLTMLGDKSLFDTLVERYLDGDDAVSRAAAAALAGSSEKQVGEAMLAALGAKPNRRGRVLDMLASIRFYEAIDPLLIEAAKPEPATYEPVMDALAKIADPDRTDLPRLTRLYLGVPEGKHRDAAARTIVRVCEKAPAGTDRSALVFDFAPGELTAKKAELLPLLGRLGGAKAKAQVATAMTSGDAAMADAAVIALCNWPDASVADELWNVATTSDNAAYARRALRAYVRVITLKSDRGEAKTLQMLQAAMKEAENDADRSLILERASTVRTMDTFRWAAGYLDTPALAPAASQCVLDLAHQKFLRNPNKAEFTPVLKRIAEEGATEEMRNRAKQYLLGM